VIDIVNVPDNYGWIGVFRPGNLSAVKRYTQEGREGELATHLPTAPIELIKVTNADFPFPIEKIPLYSPNPEWSSEKRRKHEPFMTEGFPCFDGARPFARVFPVPRHNYGRTADY